MRYGYGNSIKAFAEIDSYNFKNQLAEKIVAEIQGKNKEYILGVDEDEFTNYLIDKYSLERLQVDFENEIIEEPTISKEWLEDRMYREKYQTDVYTFTIKYRFVGSSVLFKVRPDTWTMTSTEIYLNEQEQMVSFGFKLYKKDPAEFTNAKNDFHRRAFTNLNGANLIADNWNNGLPSTVKTAFERQKTKYQSENDFFTAINVKVNQNTSSVFSAPTVKKKIIPQPTVSKQKEFSSEPMMSKEMYDDILKVIYDSGKNMEKKPALYKTRTKKV